MKKPAGKPISEKNKCNNDRQAPSLSISLWKN